MKMNRERQAKFYKLIMLAISELIIKEGETEPSISKEELEEDGALEDFFLSLTTLAPQVIFKTITDSEVQDRLEFNHLMNRLVMMDALQHSAEEGGDDIEDWGMSS